MLRIAKSTPGILDLSAVKNEHGLPVTLSGPSHQDVPDHEEGNPILQRVVELGWVTIARIPLDATGDELPTAGEPSPTPSSVPEDEKTAAPVTNTVEDEKAIEPNVADSVLDSSQPTSVEEPTIDPPAQPTIEPSTQPTSKPDRKSSRRA